MPVADPIELLPTLMSLEILNRFLVFLGRSLRFEGAEIASFACFRILFPRIQPIFAGLKFSDHEVNYLYLSSTKQSSDLRSGKRETGSRSWRTFARSALDR